MISIVSKADINDTTKDRITIPLIFKRLEFTAYPDIVEIDAIKKVAIDNCFQRLNSMNWSFNHNLPLIYLRHMNSGVIYTTPEMNAAVRIETVAATS